MRARWFSRDEQFDLWFGRIGAFALQGQRGGWMFFSPLGRLIFTDRKLHPPLFSERRRFEQGVPMLIVGGWQVRWWKGKAPA